MSVKFLLATSLLCFVQAKKSCLQCMCQVESGCRPVRCKMDVGSLSCGYFQIKLDYYKDCGMPGRRKAETVTKAWQRCAKNYNCSVKCINDYYKRYRRRCTSNQGNCQKMARLHNSGPRGCKKKSHCSLLECCEEMLRRLQVKMVKLTVFKDVQRSPMKLNI